MMRLLLVEDDEFKATDLAKAVSESVGDVVVDRAASVTSASRAILEGEYDLCVLDMSLPTFDLSGPGGGGSPQGQGGLDVLRLARHIEHPPAFLIVTQYPDIEIDRVDVPLSRAGKHLRAAFGADVLECIHYEFDSDAWRFAFQAALDNLKSRTQ